jgi:hypothetical protein
MVLEVVQAAYVYYVLGRQIYVGKRKSLSKRVSLSIKGAVTSLYPFANATWIFRFDDSARSKPRRSK